MNDVTQATTHDLTGKQRRHLRALGHSLKPVLNVGKQGIALEMLAQLEDVLLARELVKIKVLQGSPLSADECGAELCRISGAQVAQRVGRTLLLYRPHPEQPQIKLPPGREA